MNSSRSSGLLLSTGGQQREGVWSGATKAVLAGDAFGKRAYERLAVEVATKGGLGAPDDFGGMKRPAFRNK